MVITFPIILFNPFIQPYFQPQDIFYLVPQCMPNSSIPLGSTNFYYMNTSEPMSSFIAVYLCSQINLRTSNKDVLFSYSIILIHFSYQIGIYTTKYNHFDLQITNQMFFHRHISNENSPNICTCFRNHQQTNQWVHICPEHNRNVKSKA